MNLKIKNSQKSEHVFFGKEKKKTQRLSKNRYQTETRVIAILHVTNSENNWRAEGIKMPHSRWNTSNFIDL